MSTVALENALMQAVRAATGVTNARWGMQGAARQSGPFLSLQLDGPYPVGQRGIRSTYDEDADPGEEIGLHAGGLAESRLTVTAYDGTIVEEGTALSQRTARSILSDLQNGILLPTPKAFLDAAYLGLFNVSEVRDIGALLGPKFESRAQLVLRFYHSVERTERVGYIATVDITATPE